MRFVSLAWPTVALGTLSSTDAISLNRSFLDISAIPVQQLQTLQGILDLKCRELAQLACKNGEKFYCNTTIYARRDVGTASQKNKEWRCYAGTSLDFNIFGEGCVNNCGGTTMCSGAVKGASTRHLTRKSELLGELNKEKDKYCKAPPASLQEALERECYKFAEEACKKGETGICNTPVYARFGTATGNEKKWRCYSQRDLNFESFDKGCVDNCGQAALCIGAPNSKITAILTRDSELRSLIESQKNLFCSANVRSLQAHLDMKCTEMGMEFCKGGNKYFCRSSIHARFDFGTTNQREKEWRCYSAEALNFETMGEGCVDNCGKPTKCLGAVVGSSDSHLTRVSEILDVIRQNKNGYCFN